MDVPERIWRSIFVKILPDIFSITVARERLHAGARTYRAAMGNAAAKEASQPQRKASLFAPAQRFKQQRQFALTLRQNIWLDTIGSQQALVRRDRGTLQFSIGANVQGAQDGDNGSAEVIANR
jgi:hypothetical protein